LGPVAGIKFVFVLGYGLAAVGMYLFVRDRWGGIAGIVACAAFIFSPYLIFIDPHARGDAPEFLAIAAAPLMLWAFSRLRRTGSPGDAALSAVTLAVVILSHPLMGLMYFGLLLLWAAWELWLGHSIFQDAIATAMEVPPTHRPWPLLLLAIALGLGLSAFWWLPVALERGAIQLNNVAGPGFFDFRRNFLSLSEIFARSLVFDLGATDPRFHFNLGLSQWLLGLLGALTIIPRRTRRTSVMFFVFIALLGIYLLLPASIQIWEAIPLMAFFQFPSRFLGLVSLALAVLAAAAVSSVTSLQSSVFSHRSHLPRKNMPWSACGLPSADCRLTTAPASVAGETTFGFVALLAILASALPLLFPAPWGEFGPVTARRMLQVELDGRALGTTSGDDFLPVAVQVVPGPQQSLVVSFDSGGPLDRVNRVTLPQGAQVETLSHGPLFDHFRVSSPQAFIFRLYTFDFPGWTAYVDERETPIKPARPDGFITFEVPAGAHQVLVRLEDTPPRRLGWLVTGLAVLGSLGLLAQQYRLERKLASPASPPLRSRVAVTFGLLLVAFAGLRLAADRMGWFTLQSAGDTVLVAEQQQYADFGGQIALLGYDLGRRQARPGDLIPVALYWKRIGPIPENYQVFVHLIGPDGILRGQSDKLNPAGFPTRRWPDDRYVRDEHTALLQSGAPPGRFRLRVGLWRQTSGERLEARTADGQLWDAGVELADTIDVLP